MVKNYQNADCSLRKKLYCIIYYNYRHTFVPHDRETFVCTRGTLQDWRVAGRFTFTRGDTVQS